MTLNEFKRIGVLAAFLGCAALAFGQTAMTTTTLSAGVSANTTRGYVLVASATNIIAPQTAASQGGLGGPASGNNNYTLLFVDRELMRVNGVSSTTITVERGYSGTFAQAHNSGATVYVGPPSYFHNIDPSGACGGGTGTGTVTAAVTPWLVYTNGNLWNCGTDNVWHTFGADYSSSSSVGLVIASATTIAPLNPMFHVSGTTAIATITPPPNMAAGECLYLVPNGIFTTTTAGNIALASTAVVSKTLLECYDGTSFFPSY